MQSEKISKPPVPAYDGDRPYVFISYSHKDSQAVYPMVKFLSEKKFRVWYDEGIKVGRNYAEELFRRVSNCSALIVFLSENSVSSIHVANEVGIAFDNEIRIIPIWLSSELKLPDNMSYWLRFTHQHSMMLGVGSDGTTLGKKFLDAIPDLTRDNAVIENGVLLDSEEDVVETALPLTVNEIGRAAFKNRTSLKHIEFPANIVRIGDEAFRNCASLTDLVIGSSIQYVGVSAFRDCTRLKNLVIERSKEYGVEIGERAFENCIHLENVVLPDDLAEIFSGVFNSCKSLKTIRIPKSVTVIGDNAFASCSALESITIPPTLTKIDDAAFNGCSALTEIVIPEGTTKLGKNVFKECLNVKKVALSKTVAKLDSGDFRGCLALKEIVVDSQNKHLKSVDNILFSKNKSELLCYPAAREGKTFSVPDSVVKISDWAFSDCENLTEVILPDTVEEIGEGAFYRCTALEKIVLPESVTLIEDTAFRGCKNLKEVVIKSTTASELGWGIFYGCPEDMRVTCLHGAYEKYFKDKSVDLTVVDAL